ncbi:CpaF family protein [Paenibacillus sp. 481]|uniref:CpaF family protein n=1 Tax=Paenibacillus sp. 481 TaxID=2835869 RepID=UPI001E61C90F|nr:ATPase, T2SS/T4P/T4SS family [Paenibacillus sp. 481]UHA76095.1 CpaF family protein [Paenibacillus sp. 481]
MTSLEQLSLVVRQKVRDSMEWGDPLHDDELLRRIETTLFAESGMNYLTASEIEHIVQRIFYAFRGLDVLQPLVDDPSITEIMINSHEELFIERKGKMELLPMSFENKEKLEDIIQSIVSQMNRVVNESSPIALKGPTVTIRKFPDKPLTMSDRVRIGALTDEAAALLQMLVKAKYNLFISGGTGSGKTTFLNALSQYIPADERVITIEDAAELQIRTVPNLVSLETRNANTEGKGEVAIRDLIRASLRMRPNRIVVGEVRGPEALDMLQAIFI